MFRKAGFIAKVNTSVEGTPGKYSEAIVGFIDTDMLKAPIGSRPKFISIEKLKVPGK